MDELATLVSLVMSTVTLLGGLFVYATRLAQMELKINTMWEFMMRRAKGEAVQFGLGDLNSPFIINDAGRKAIAPFAARIAEFRKTLPKGITDLDTMLRIEDKFGDEIVKEVCIPYKMTTGACLILAMEASKEVA